MPERDVATAVESTIGVNRDPSGSKELYVRGIIDVVSVGANTPPGSPSANTRYVVGTAPTGAWSGHANEVATYNSTGALGGFDAPIANRPGSLVMSRVDASIWKWTGTAWVQVSDEAALATAQAAQQDATDALAAAAAAQSTAVGAATAASNAQDTADDAAIAASGAAAAAANAQTAAEAAQETADDAETAAASAASAAASAVTTANTAGSQAQSALNAAQSAQTAAESAQNIAADAQADADTALAAVTARALLWASELRFYLAVTGNDANAGTSSGAPWQTIGRVSTELGKYAGVGKLRLTVLGSYEILWSQLDASRCGAVICDGVDVSYLSEVITLASGTTTGLVANASLTDADQEGPGWVNAQLQVLTGARAGERRRLRGYQRKLPVATATNASITLSGLQDISGVTGADGLRYLNRHGGSSTQGIYIMRAGAHERAHDARVFRQLGGAEVEVTGGTQAGIWRQVVQLSAFSGQVWTQSDLAMSPNLPFGGTFSAGDTVRVYEPAAAIDVSGLDASFPSVIGRCPVTVINLRIVSAEPSNFWVEGVLVTHGVDCDDQVTLFGESLESSPGVIGQAADQVMPIVGSLQDGLGTLLSNLYIDVQNTVLGYWHARETVSDGFFALQGRFIWHGGRAGSMTLRGGSVVDIAANNSDTVIIAGTVEVDGGCRVLMNNVDISSADLSTAIRVRRGSTVEVGTVRAGASIYGLDAEGGGRIEITDNTETHGETADAHVRSANVALSYFAAGGYAICDVQPPFADGSIICRQVASPTNDALARARVIDGSGNVAAHTDDTIIVDNTLAAVEYQLPDPALRKRGLKFVFLADPAVNNVTFIRHGSENINGAAASYVVSEGGANHWRDADTDGTDYYVSAAASSATGVSEEFVNTAVAAHSGLTNNPHAVTKTQVGLGNVTDAAQLTRGDNDWAGFSAKATPVAADRILLEDSAASHAKARATLSAIPHGVFSGVGTNTHEQIDAHIASTSNPHGVTAAQVGAVPTGRVLTAGVAMNIAGGGSADLSDDRTLDVVLGTTADSACAGNDSRLSNSRAPTGAAAGDLGGSYPSPTVLAAQFGSTRRAFGTATASQLLSVHADGTIVGIPAPAGLVLDQYTGGPINTAVQVVTPSAGTAAINLALGNYFRVTMTSNTAFTFSGASARPGAGFVLEVIQSGGSWTASFPTDGSVHRKTNENLNPSSTGTTMYVGQVTAGGTIRLVNASPDGWEANA